MIDIAGAVVAEEMIQLREGFRNIGPRAPVNQIDALPGMGVIKAKLARFFGRDRFCSPLDGGAEKQQDYGQASQNSL